MSIKITKMKIRDIKMMAKIASYSFSGMKNIKDALKWIKCNFNVFPRMQYFVARSGNQVLGYILWTERGGFRKRSVWELEQIAVNQDFRGQGIGKQLIKKSLLEIKKGLKKRGSTLKLIEVTTGVENKAQKIYKDVLGAEVECVIKDLFRSDEVIMFARFK